MSEHGEDIKGALMSHLHGIDNLKQILDLWFEVSYLRCVLMEICNQNSLGLDPKAMERAKEQAKTMMKGKFPTIDLDYNNPKETK